MATKVTLKRRGTTRASSWMSTGRALLADAKLLTSVSVMPEQFRQPVGVAFLRQSAGAGLLPAKAARRANGHVCHQSENWVHFRRLISLITCSLNATASGESFRPAG